MGGRTMGNGHEWLTAPSVFGTTVVTGDLYGCNALRYRTTECILQSILEIISENKLTVRETYINKWQNGSVLAVIVLEESHVIFTTYPERSEGYFVQLDVVLCNYTRDNYLLTKLLFNKTARIFEPKIIGYISVARRGPSPTMVSKTLLIMSEQWILYLRRLLGRGP